jgi:hypothetical protein
VELSWEILLVELGWEGSTGWNLVGRLYWVELRWEVLLGGT